MARIEDVTISRDPSAPAQADAVLRLEDLRKVYGATVAVTDTWLSVSEGEFVTLLGPSGSGKTTTLLSVAGFVIPDGGRIILDGQDVSRVPPHRRDIGIVFQSYALFPHLTVGKNVAFPLTMRGIKGEEAKRQVMDVLEIVELTQLVDRHPRQLSGGQQQRVALARALVFSPRLLLMDEPLGALDKRLRSSLQFEIKRIADDVGATVLYVTHDQEEAMAMSDRIAVFRDGSILQLGTPEELYDRPCSAFVAEFLGDSNVVHGTLQNQSGELVLRVADWNLPVNARACGELGLGAADSAAVAIRPERIAIERESPNGPDGSELVRLPGLVRETVFLGASDRVVVSTPLGDLLVHAPTPAVDERLAAGDPVTVSWSVNHGVVVEA